MDCMQSYIRSDDGQRDVFQYRKRYGLHAMQSVYINLLIDQSFNTASGMDCMQFIVENANVVGVEFQYRKRYGLHAIKKVEVF